MIPWTKNMSNKKINFIQQIDLIFRKTELNTKKQLNLLMFRPIVLAKEVLS